MGVPLNHPFSMEFSVINLPFLYNRENGGFHKWGLPKMDGL